MAFFIKDEKEFVLPDIIYEYKGCTHELFKKLLVPNPLDRDKRRNSIKDQLQEHVTDYKIWYAENGISTPDYSLWVALPEEGECCFTVDYEDYPTAPNTRRFKYFENRPIVKNEYIDIFEKKSVNYILSGTVRHHLKMFDEYRENFRLKEKNKIYKSGLPSSSVQYQEFIIGDNAPKTDYQIQCGINPEDQLEGKKYLLGKLSSILEDDKFDAFEVSFKTVKRNTMREFLSNALKERWADAQEIEISTMDFQNTLYNYDKKNYMYDEYEEQYAGNYKTLKFTAILKDGSKEYLIVATRRHINSYNTQIINLLLTDSDIIGMKEGNVSPDHIDRWVIENKFNPREIVSLDEVLYIIGAFVYDREFLPFRVLDHIEGGCRIYVNDPYFSINLLEHILIPQYHILCAMAKLFMLGESQRNASLKIVPALPYLIHPTTTYTVETFFSIYCPGIRYST